MSDPRCVVVLMLSDDKHYIISGSVVRVAFTGPPLSPLDFGPDELNGGKLEIEFAKDYELVMTGGEHA